MGNISPFTEHGLEILPLIFSVFCELLPFHIQQNNFIKLFGSIRFNPLPFEIISRITIHLSHVPSVSGPLKVGNSLVDAFTLQYYEGFPMDQVAWGEIKSDQQWKVLSKLKNGYQDSLFTSPEVARNVAKPLVSYIDKALVTDRTSAPKITVLVGHDSNIASLLTALDFKPYQLHDQNERTPIGGKIVFQRWHDSKANRDLMKIEYVYQSAEQLRNADALTLQAPAQRVTLELSGCPIDANGFCPMDKFDSVLNEAVK